MVRLQTEVCALSCRQSCAQIVNFIGICSLNNDDGLFCPALVTEAAQKSLFQLLYEGNSLYDCHMSCCCDVTPFLRPIDLFSYSLQIARGLQHLHHHNIVHRDLCSHNILIFNGLLFPLRMNNRNHFCDVAQQTVKITGLSKALIPKARHYIQQLPMGLHVAWCSPEMLRSSDGVVEKTTDLYRLLTSVDVFLPLIRMIVCPL